MIRAVVSGALARQPEARQSKAGRPYVLATIREGSGDKVRWVTAFFFSDEAREAVTSLVAGDAISVSGEIEAEVYVPEGSPPRISWSIRVDAVMTANSGARKRSATEPEPLREGPDDPIPF